MPSPWRWRGCVASCASANRGCAYWRIPHERADTVLCDGGLCALCLGGVQRHVCAGRDRGWRTGAALSPACPAGGTAACAGTAAMAEVDMKRRRKHLLFIIGGVAGLGIAAGLV